MNVKCQGPRIRHFLECRPMLRVDSHVFLMVSPYSVRRVDSPCSFSIRNVRKRYTRMETQHNFYKAGQLAIDALNCHFVLFCGHFGAGFVTRPPFFSRMAQLLGVSHQTMLSDVLHLRIDKLWDTTRICDSIRHQIVMYYCCGYYLM